MASYYAEGSDPWADLFLSAALEPHLWDQAIRAMAQATGSRHGQLIGFGHGAAGFNWISDVEPDIVDKSATIDGAAPDLNFRVAADQLSGRPEIVHEAHYDIARQSLRSADYLDLCSDYDIFDGCQTRLFAGPDMMIGLALLRGRKDGRTDQDQRDLFAHVAGHARNAVRLQRAIEHQGFALLAGTFETMDRACWLLDATGRVGGMTPRAEALLSTSRLRVGDGWLQSERSDETRAILRSVRAVVDAPAREADPVALGLGSCIDCTLCVQVCPTGIDIRNGLQNECIGCAACIDVCDDVMDKMGYPQGLIRYTTGNAVAKGWSARQMLRRVWRPRVLIYGTLLAGLTGAWLWSLAHRSDVAAVLIKSRTSLAGLTRMVRDLTSKSWERAQ